MLVRPAGQGSARTQIFALQRHDIQRVMILPRQRNGIVDMVCHDYPPDQIGNDAVILRIVFEQLRRHAQHAPLSQHIRPAAVFLAVHARQRQECGAPRMILFQKRDHPLRRVLILGHNVLDTAAERRFHRRLVFLRHMDQVGNDTDQPRLRRFLLHHPLDRIAVALIPFRDIADRFITGLRLVDLALFAVQFL